MVIHSPPTTRNPEWQRRRHRYLEVIVIKTDNGLPWTWNGEEAHAMQQYLWWAGVTHKPTLSALTKSLAERLMQLVGRRTNLLNSLNTAHHSQAENLQNGSLEESLELNF